MPFISFISSGRYLVQHAQRTTTIGRDPFAEKALMQQSVGGC